jgi:ADP-ribose pyrophosphatase
MSRAIFKYLAPALLALASFYFLRFAPDARQQVSLGFAWFFYLVVRYSYYKFGQSPAQATPLTPAKRDGGISEELRVIALHEYEYVRETMAQAMNDRHTLINYFLLVTGVVLATIGAVYSKEGLVDFDYKLHLTVVICLMFCLIAWTYFLKIVRLRQAWCESCAAMNRIKQFFLVNEERSVPEEQSPFLWKSNTIPLPAKKGNLFHLEALLINFVSALALGAVSVLLLPPETWDKTFWIPFVFFAFGFFLQLSAYTVFLEEKPNKKAKAEPQTLRALDCNEQARKIILHEERLALDDFFKVKKAALQFEKFDGTLGEKIEQLSFIRGRAVAILLYDEAARDFIFIEQFRYPYFESQRERGWIIEIVAGMVDQNETPLAAAQRETIEEIGYSCEEVKPLAEFYVSPGSSAEHVSVFWGKLGKKISEGGGKTSENENLRLVRMPVAEAYRRLEEGKFQDAKTMIALLKARPFLERR